MALATICPHCTTTFRVASDQLKLRGGIVRCGACNQVFDGNAALIDVDAAATSAPVAVSGTDIAPTEPAASSIITTPSASAASDATVEVEVEVEVEVKIAATDARTVAPRHSLDFDSIDDPLGITPKPEVAPSAAAVPRIDEAIIGFALRDDGLDPGSQLDQPDQPDQHHRRPEPPPAPPVTPLSPQPEGRDPPLPMRASAMTALVPLPAPASTLPAALARTARRNAAKRQRAIAAAALLTAQANEPEFVKRSRRQAQTRPTRRLAMGVASAMLALVLAAQGLSTFRNVLAARFPQWKPVLQAGCAVFGCRVALPAQIDTLSVETGELQALNANTFSYATLLRNPGSLTQAWPHLELVLTDANDKALVRRVFTPADYLPPGVLTTTGLGPRSEQSVTLFFELDQLKAAGYHIAIFYP